ncbi:hypothetical protein KDD17_16360 [Sulfitobacter albidus]|uniref:Peptidase inhibitor I78 family protein n=1 Tax=Sulfitobacter albidus TaxID=2829501 RepID=A0A975JDG6_9RHOB|nr:I78 family peptidase inhibitor [Sulfitobacter albidus]QUJ76433.1 hypothetical protein KDD17_16360 [Sulfitobacter albidus]
MRYAILTAVLVAGCGAVVPPAGGGAPAGGPDTCGAAAQQGLIGQDAAAALIVPEPKRVYRTDEAVTQDLVPERVNVLLDETDVIVSVSCG